MQTHNLKEVQSNFRPLFYAAQMGEVVVIVDENGREVKLVATKVITEPRSAGSAKGQIWMSEDFDEPIEDFADYSE